VDFWECLDPVKAQASLFKINLLR